MIEYWIYVDDKLIDVNYKEHEVKFLLNHFSGIFGADRVTLVVKEETNSLP